MSNPTVRITGNRLPVYFQGRHRSVYLNAFGRNPQPVEPASRPADQELYQRSAPSGLRDRPDRVLVGSAR